MDAAIRAGQLCGRPVAEVPLSALADAAGMSRSTLLRRLGGSRRALDEAVRKAGVDPGGQPVRERAIEAGARLISQRGLASVTLESVAEAAHCSMPSLHAIFGTRDRLFAAIYERYSPLRDLMGVFADPTASIEQTVAGFYQAMAVGLTREPQVAPAMLADLLANPHGPSARIFAEYFPHAVSAIGGWLQQQVDVGAIRDIPIPLLMGNYRATGRPPAAASRYRAGGLEYPLASVRRVHRHILECRCPARHPRNASTRAGETVSALTCLMCCSPPPWSCAD